MIGTYIMFSKEQKELDRIIGPFFYDQKDHIREQYFNERDGYLMEESVFAENFPDSYNKHIRMAWMDKMHCYFLTNLKWIGDVVENLEGKYVRSEWFVIYEMISENSGPFLQLSFLVESDPFHVARLKMDMLEMNTLPIALAKSYYRNSSNQIFVEGALTKHLADKVMKDINLS